MPYATSAAAVDSRYFLLDGTRNITGPTTIINNVPLLASDVLTIRGAAGQTGKLLTLENSALTDVFTVDNAGAIVGASLTLTGNIVLGNTSKVIGGSSTTADLTLQTTSGVGASGADMHFLVGNAGATEAITVLNNGRVGINNTAPRAVLTIGNDDPYTGGLYVASYSGFIARYSSVFEFVMGVNPTVGQGIRVDGSNRKVNLLLSPSITVDSEALELDTPNSNSLFSGPTTGDKTFIRVGTQAEFKPTSGTATLAWMRIRGLINQTGGANGITRGLYINTTITAAADWRSLEISPNTGYAIYQSGASADNYFAGDVGIKTLVPNNALDVTGTVQADGLRLDVTPTAETIVPTHTITISVNGTSYKIPIVLA